ncbi:MAG TPA: DUF4340 domain-containing protein [Tepidisphaeraceae bacterium]|jgi:hypothetical protein
MNFKTTVILIVLLAVIGGVLFFTRNKGDESKIEQTTSTEERKLLDWNSADVTKVALTQAGGGRIAFERAGGKWEMIEPLRAQVDQMRVDALVDDVLGIRSHGQTDAASAGTGLAKPTFSVELANKNGKTTKIDVGDRSSIGDNLYVRLDGAKKAEIVGARLYDALEKPAANYRKAKLVDLSAATINQVIVTEGDTKMVLNKVNGEWKMIEPDGMPLDNSAVTDMLVAVTGLQASDFVQADSTKLASYGLSSPKMTVWLSEAAPTTQPTLASASAPATLPVGITVKFGRPEDVLGKSVYAMVSTQDAVAKVPASAMQAFEKKPFELRNKEVADIVPAKVEQITLSRDVPATTQPTTKPALEQQIVLERTRAPISPLGPATQPAAATQSTAAPASQATTQPLNGWAITSQSKGIANEQAVEQFLAKFHPLRVEKYLPGEPTTKPAGTYTLTLRTDAVMKQQGAQGMEHTFTFIDDGARVIGSYRGLVFEVDRALLKEWETDFTKAPPPAPMPPRFDPGDMGGMQ